MSHIPFTSEEKSRRRQGIGASECPAALGASPWQTPLDVCRSKWEPDFDLPVTPPMEWGGRLEAEVARWFSDQHPGLVLTPSATIAHPTVPIMFATPDRIVRYKRDRAGLQIKCTRWPSGWGEPETDQVPPHVFLQVQDEMECAELDRMHVAVLIGGNEPRHYLVPRDREVGKLICGALTNFWTEYVQPHRPPPIDGSDSWRKFLDQLYPRPPAPAVFKADAAIERIAAQLRAARASTAASEELEARLKNELRGLIGDQHTGVDGDGWTARWTAVKGRTTIDTKALIRAAEISPDLVAKFSKTGEPSSKLVVKFDGVEEGGES